MPSSGLVLTGGQRQPDHTAQLRNRLWKNVASSTLDNIFCIPLAQKPGDYDEVPLQGTQYKVDDECRRKLQAALGEPCGAFPPTDVLNQGLDLFIRQFHPAVPFIHLPTFSAKDAPPLLLYTMCLTGMVVLGTKEALNFVRMSYLPFLSRIKAELDKCSASAGNDSTPGTLSIFATAFLLLNMVVFTKEYIEKSTMLWVDLISIAQYHGLFASIDGQILNMNLWKTIQDRDARWKAWGRVESVKRMIVGLLLLDSWYSWHLCRTPIITPGSVQFIPPYNQILFMADTSAEWELIDGGNNLLLPIVLTPLESIKVPLLSNPVDGICMYGVLAMIQLRQSEAYHRLLLNRASQPFIPCYVFATDGRARCLLSLQIQIAHQYSDVLEQLNPNVTIMWHTMCMSLTADLQLFIRASERDVPTPVRKTSLRQIKEWSQTPAARRACLHAAHIYKAIHKAIANDVGPKHLLFHSESSFFIAALVLALYKLTVPEPRAPPAGSTSIELLNDLRWPTLGTECFVSIVNPEPSDNLAINFIRNSGTVSMGGVPLPSGSLSARHILRMYERLFEKSAKWNVGNLLRGLRLFHDDLFGTELLSWDTGAID
ncbi:hypothetical protein P168DRAFT_343780 [Aspergillus campestris IBT 28561]|uniref:Xylanolytic transcriptional activator regulatory domain-containing protein n=1 Tax=Aspergillus campestris (strain IBT 28561) TaxID=1392248 RepID=A0A2I1D377_ASPC2|nr:uncharacterized protein P168DRAFT_343780 [Aspergillus campestris IBT 28561]PKY04331.1 hypothetical protein P168DRAFT_343780 [Aspergillus campestris IBT 28561]